MERRTYSALLGEVRAALDLQNETTITDAEYVDYCNDAIEEAESIIHDLHEDYFKTHKKLQHSTGYGLVANKAKYALPENIFANKIKEIVFNDDDLIYEIKAYHPRRKQTTVEYMNKYFTDDNRIFMYQLVNNNTYDPANPMTTNFQIEMIPTPKITGNWVTVYYLREATKIPYTDNSDVYIDIPEFYNFVKAKFMEKCAFKSINPKYTEIKDEASRIAQTMIRILSKRKEDDSKAIFPDYSFYEEHV